MSNLAQTLSPMSVKSPISSGNVPATGRNKERLGVMRMIIKAALAAGLVGAITGGTSSATLAQGVYIGTPGLEIGVGRPYRERGYGGYDYDRRPGYVEREYGGRRDGDRIQRRSYRRDREGNRDRDGR
jgi:hypothetical protein